MPTDASKCREYYAKNRDKLRAYKKSRRLENPRRAAIEHKTSYLRNREKYLAYYKKWYSLNKDKVASRTKSYRQQNKLKCTELTKKWVKANRDKRKAYNKKYAKDNYERHALIKSQKIYGEYAKVHRLIVKINKQLNNSCLQDPTTGIK